MIRFFGKLCTMPLLCDICQFAIGNLFGTFAPSSYYNVNGAHVFLIGIYHKIAEHRIITAFIPILSGVIVGFFIDKSKWR